MTTLFDSAAPVKIRRPFGTLPDRERRMPYTAKELQEAIEMFADAEADRLDEQALQAAWDDQFNDTLPPAGHCQNCGEPCDHLTPQGLCDRCDDLATDAAIAGQNGRAGLGYRVF